VFSCIFEETAWNKGKEVIENPKMILAELKKRADASRSGNGRIEKEIARIQKKIAVNDSQQQRFLTLFGNGSINEDAVVDKLSQLKEEKQQFEDRISRLAKSMAQQIDINTAKEKIQQYCKRMKRNLDKCTLQDKKKALNALDVQIVAIPGEMKIRIAVPLECTTIEQTSVCMFTHNKNHRSKVTADINNGHIFSGRSSSLMLT